MDDVHLGRSAFAPGSASASAEDLQSFSLTQLRAKARRTPGIKEKKKVEGKWIPKDRLDFLSDFNALQEAASAQPLASSAAAAQNISKLAISPRLRHLHRELSGPSSDSGEDTVLEHGRSGPGSASPPVAIDRKALERLSSNELRALASQTPGITAKFKNDAGSWRYKTDPALIEALLSGAVQASPQSLTGGCSAADKKKRRQERKRELKRTDKYKMVTRVNQKTAKFRFAQNARRKQSHYKEKKKLYERTSTATLSRVQRRWARFWEPCLCNWTATRKSGVRGDG